MWRFVSFFHPPSNFSKFTGIRKISRCFSEVTPSSTLPIEQRIPNSKTSKFLWFLIGSGIGSATSLAISKKIQSKDKDVPEITEFSDVVQDDLWPEPVKKFIRNRIKEYSEEVTGFQTGLKELNSCLLKLKQFTSETLLEDKAAWKELAEEVAMCKRKLMKIKSGRQHLFNSIEIFLTNLGDLRSQLPLDQDMEKIFRSLNRTNLLNGELALLEKVAECEASLSDFLHTFTASKQEILSKYFELPPCESSLLDSELDSSILCHFLKPKIELSHIPANTFETVEPHGEISDKGISPDVYKQIIDDLTSIQYKNLEEALERQKSRLSSQWHEDTLSLLAEQYKNHVDQIDDFSREINQLKTSFSKSKSSFYERFLLWDFVEASAKLQECCLASINSPTLENHGRVILDTMSSLLSHPFSIHVEPELIAGVANSIPEEALTKGVVYTSLLRKQAKELACLSRMLVFLQDQPITLWSCAISWLHSKIFKFSPQFYERSGAISNYVDIARQYDLVDEIEALAQNGGDLEELYNKIIHLDSLPRLLYDDWMKQCEVNLQFTELMKIMKSSLKNRVLVSY